VLPVASANILQIVIRKDGQCPDAIIHLDLARIFDHLIIGPALYPFSMLEAFESNLQKAGVSLAARERKAGPTGMAEGLVVLTKPVTPVGGKGPQLKADARSDDPRDIGDEPDNS